VYSGTSSTVRPQSAVKRITPRLLETILCELCVSAVEI
jgi:hypothetical protein